jgi:hypothetical protein
MNMTIAKLLAFAAAACSWHLVAGCSSGGCLLDHSELSAMDPQVNCLDVQGNKPNNSQCDVAAMQITNNCSDVLVIAQGTTVDGGKLTFAPGESGRFDAAENMQTSPNQWETTATLGTQTIKFTIRTYRR